MKCAFFFEIEFVPLDALYFTYLIVAFIGFALGLVRWWLGTVWLLGPLLLLVLIFGMQLHEGITEFYDHMIRQMGYSYIAHNVIAPLVGVMLNVAGIGFGFIRRAEPPIES